MFAYNLNKIFPVVKYLLCPSRPGPFVNSLVYLFSTAAVPDYPFPRPSRGPNFGKWNEIFLPLCRLYL